MTRLVLRRIAVVCLILMIGPKPWARADDLFWRTERAADPCFPRQKDGDEIWIISSRCLETCDAIDVEKLCAFEWMAGEWEPSKWNGVVDGHRRFPDKHTVVFLHGNRTDIYWSAKRGQQVFDSVFGADHNRPDVRFVIWSWPTDPQHRRLKEYRENSQRSVWEGQILAEFLNQLGSDSPIGMIGYSFGAQAVVVASEQACSHSSDETARSHQFGIVLLAPALQKPWNNVESPLAASEHCVSTSIELVNSRDRALKIHRCLNKFSGGGFAWTTGVDELAGATSPSAEWDIGDLVGRRHDVVRYVSHPDVALQIRRTTLLEIDELQNAK